MKAIINKVTGSSASFEIEFDVFDDKGDLYFSKSLVISYIQEDVDLAVEYCKKAILTEIEKFNKEKASVTKSEIQKLVGLEIQF